MARLITYVETEALVDHQSFDLLDDGGPQEVTPAFDDPSRWLFTGRNSVTVVSPGSHPHDVGVIVELWDAEPSSRSGFDKVTQTTLHLDSGLLEVNPLVEENPESLETGGPGTYNLRAHAAGRDNPAAAEHYLFQVWRADSA